MCVAMKLVLTEVNKRGLLRHEQFMDSPTTARYGIKKGLEFDFLFKTQSLTHGMRYGITPKGKLYLMGGISLVATAYSKGSGRGKDIPVTHWHTGLIPV